MTLVIRLDQFHVADAERLRDLEKRLYSWIALTVFETADILLADVSAFGHCFLSQVTFGT